jgi:hypothetical protein
VPDRRSIFRLLALAGFLLTVALALWLAELRPLFVVIVMALALLLAWAVEWLSWRQELVPVAQAVETEEDELVPAMVGEPMAEPEPVVAVAVAEGVVEPPVEPPEPEPEVEPAPVADEPPAVEPEPPAPAPPVVVPVEPPPEPVRAAPEPPREEPAPRPPLRPVPPPAPAEPPPPPAPPPPVREPAPAAAGSDVIDLRTRATAQPRLWNLWDLETRAREHAQVDPDRSEEWSYLFVHLRQFATPDGSLPTEFDGLIRESFGDLLERAG